MNSVAAPLVIPSFRYEAAGTTNSQLATLPNENYEEVSQ